MVMHQLGNIISGRETIHFKPWIKHILIVSLYGFVAFCLLIPLMPDDRMGDAPDFPNHVAAIIQAKIAIEQGQFPIRTAPLQHFGWQYPNFQYYSNLPYTVAGYIYKYISLTNPYWVFKFLCWVSLTISAVYIYKLTKFLIDLETAALLSGTVYMCAPYFLVNILARGAWTEVIAQGIIPIVLYYSFRCYYSPGIKYIVSASLAWFALATTHIITFVFSGLFIGLLFLIIVIFQKDFNRSIRIIKLGASVLLGCCLSAYFLAPIILRPSLTIDDSIVKSPFENVCTTPLSSLLSPISSTPQGCAGTRGLSPSIGWPILISWLLSTYLLVFRRPKINSVFINKAVFYACYIIFCLATLMAWSPLNYWSLIPRYFWVIQFTYRLLTYTMWSGAILAAYALVFIFEGQFKRYYNVIVFFAVCLSSISYLVPQNYIYTLSAVLKNPDLGYGKTAYLMNTSDIQSNWITGNLQLPIVYSDGWLINNQSVPILASRINTSTVIKISGFVPELFLEGVTLSTWQDGENIASKHFSPGPFVWEFPIFMDTQNKSKDVYLKFKTDHFFIPERNSSQSSDSRRLSVSINNAIIDFGSSDNAMPVTETQKKCIIENGGISCELTDVKYSIIQLPILYYPFPLVDVKINHRETKSFATLNQGYLLSSVTVKAGESYHIEARFQGLPWANFLSLGSWVLLLGLLLMERIIFLPLPHKADKI